MKMVGAHIELLSISLALGHPANMKQSGSGAGPVEQNISFGQETDTGRKEYTLPCNYCLTLDNQVIC